MAAFLATPAGMAVVGGIIEAGKGLIERMFPDKEKQAAERAKAEMELAQLVQSGSLKELEVRMSAILAEANSADPWTSRARPSFLYVMYIMILFAIPMGFVSAWRPELAQAIAAGMKAWLSAIPDELYTLFGVGYVGYAGVRMFEKRAGVAK